MFVFPYLSLLKRQERIPWWSFSTTLLLGRPAYPPSMVLCSFSPVRKLRVASYIYHSFLACFSILLRFTGRVNFVSLDVSSQNLVFGSQFHSVQLVNSYSINSADRRVHSVLPDPVFPDIVLPLLVV